MEKKHLLLILGAFSGILLYFQSFIDINYQVNKFFEIFSLSLAPLILLIPFWIIFLFVRKEVFDYWLSFSVWFLPLSMGIVFFLYWRGESGGGWGISSGIGEFFVSFILYAIFISVSLARICIAGYEAKTGKKIAPIPSFVIGVVMLSLVVWISWFIGSQM